MYSVYKMGLGHHPRGVHQQKWSSKIDTSPKYISPVKKRRENKEHL